IENPEAIPQLCSQLISNKAGKNILWEGDGLFNKWCWGSWSSTCKNKLDHFPTPYTNSKWMKGLTVKLEAIKILEENTGSNFLDINHSNFFEIYLLRQEKQKQK
ncbi:LORF2 protein, partial [Crocuta crocuta]